MQDHPGDLWTALEPAISESASRNRRERSLRAMFWVVVICAGLLLTLFARELMPAKFARDAQVMQLLLNSPELWSGLSFDSYINTARFWWLLFQVVPQPMVAPLFFCLLAGALVLLLRVLHVQQMRYHLLAGGWLLCSSLFLTFANKEMMAVPVALLLCLARSRLARVTATLVFLLYAAFFRQYWAICFFYFACVLVCLRLHIAKRHVLALVLLVCAYPVPFLAASAAQYEPLTDARTMVNAQRVDSPDARSAFDNTFENTGPVSDLENAALAWAYMNVPVALAAKGSPQYVVFALFQLSTLWFFAAGCASFLADAKSIGYTGSTYLRCCAFAIAYSLTQAIFEPDFGSFLRHEVVLMIPMLIVAFYRAHAASARDLQPAGFAYGRHVSAYL